MAPIDKLTDHRSQSEREHLYEDLVVREVPKTGHDVFKPMTTDSVVQPQHYARFKIQPLEFVLANDIGYVEGNVIKYVCRWKFKNGVEDLKKAREYLDKYIERLEPRS